MKTKLKIILSQIYILFLIIFILILMKNYILTDPIIYLGSILLLLISLTNLTLIQKSKTPINKINIFFPITSTTLYIYLLLTINTFCNNQIFQIITLSILYSISGISNLYITKKILK